MGNNTPHLFKQFIMNFCSHKYNWVYLLVLLFISLSCGGGGDGDDLVDSKPKNLIITAQIKGSNASNPDGDGSGTVTISWTADNANNYVVNFGDNSDAVETRTNSLTHSFSVSNTYTIIVSAYNENGFISQSIDIDIYVEGFTDPNLVWSEEFNYTGSPNSSIWNFEIGNNNGWGNNEVQYYTDRASNVTVNGSALVITAKAESHNGYNYTSARITTQNKFDFKYKRVEVKAKLPSAKGTWPAIWLLGSDFSSVGWPHCGEIDIMEQNGWDKNVVYGTCHWWNSTGNHNASFGNTTSVSNTSSEWHIYKLEWSDQSIMISVDNKLYYTMTNNSGLPFNQNFFMILNIAMGGSLGGDIDSGFTESAMEIDYIRVYE